MTTHITLGAGTGRFLKKLGRRLIPGVLGLALAFGIATESRAGIVYEFRANNSALLGTIDLPSLSGVNTRTDVFFSYNIFGLTFTEADLGVLANWLMDSSGNLLNLAFGAAKLDVFGLGSGIQASLQGSLASASLFFAIQNTGAPLSDDFLPHRTVLLDDGGLLGPPVVDPPVNDPPVNDPPIAVPEPNALLLFGFGLAFILFLARPGRRRQDLLAGGAA